MKDIVDKHLKNTHELDNDEIELILEESPRCIFSGEIFRVLIFKKQYEYDNFDINSLAHDKHWTRNLDYIHHFLKTQDTMSSSFDDYETHIVVVRAITSEAVDIPLYAKENDLRYGYAQDEGEVVPLTASDISIIYKGLLKEY